MHHIRRTVQASHDTQGIRGEMPETVRIWLLGGFRVSVGPGTIEDKEWRVKKAVGQ